MEMARILGRIKRTVGVLRGKAHTYTICDCASLTTSTPATLRGILVLSTVKHGQDRKHCTKRTLSGA